MELTQETIKEFKPTETEIKAAEMVFLNMANVETIKPIVTGYQKTILGKHKFKAAAKCDSDYIFKETGLSYITDPEHTYLMSDDDFKIYLSETETEHKKHGFNVKKDYCPLLIAQADLNDAQRLFIDTLGLRFGISNKDLYSLEHRKKFLELGLNLIAPFLDDTKKILKKYGGA